MNELNTEHPTSNVEHRTWGEKVVRHFEVRCSMFGVRCSLLQQSLFGLALGLVLAVIATRFLTALLYGFRPDSTPTLAAASLILLAVSALACFVPARRAARINPVEAFRYE